MMVAPELSDVISVIMSIIISGTTIEIPEPGAYFVSIPPRVEYDRAYAKFAIRIKKRPIAVLAPGNRYAGYGLVSNGATIYVFRYNWYVERATRQFTDGRAVPPSGINEDGLATSWLSDGLTPNPAEAVEWALGKFRKNAVEPGFWPTPGIASWNEWISAARQVGVDYSEDEVNRFLSRLGLPSVPR